MPADLVGGSYHLYDPAWTAIGRLPNANQGNIAARSNAHFLGLGGITEEQLLTKKQYLAAIPVEWGDVISKVSVPIFSKGETGSVTFAAIYEGLPSGKKAKLLGQSKAVTAEVKEKALFSAELEAKVEITPTNAPYGYVYAGLQSEEGTTVCKVAGWTIKKKTQSYATNYPLWALVVAQKAAKEAAAEVAVEESEQSEIVPWVILT